MASPKKKPKRGKVPMSKIPADPFVSIGAAFTALGDAGALLRRRLAEIDPLDHPAKWAGVNDQIRGLEEQIAGLRDAHQQIALARAELRMLGADELAELREATTHLTALVAAAERVAALSEAAGKLMVATGAAITKMRERG
jgi:phosphoserine phosphatase